MPRMTAPQPGLAGQEPGEIGISALFLPERRDAITNGSNKKSPAAFTSGLSDAIESQL
jgi:hypothetical protein